MSEIIIHRVNKIKYLKKINKKYGVEIDIRSKNSNLILNHEPYQNGDNLHNYLENFDHGTIILNVKESGIENDVKKLMKNYKIKSYFFLDIEIPFIFNSLKKKFKKIAVRFSEHEPIEMAKILQNKIDWIWIDTVNKLPINHNNIKIINKFKSCLVCPERWGRKKDIIKYKNKMLKMNFSPDAIMTDLKFAKLWK